MRDWRDDEIRTFVVNTTHEEDQNYVEGPAVLGKNVVWRCWTRDADGEYHAHYVIAGPTSEDLQLLEDFQRFAVWLAIAFNIEDAHERWLDWVRSVVAATIILTLLGLCVWAFTHGQAKDIDFMWLVAGLTASSVAYLLGDWTRRRRR